MDAPTRLTDRPLWALTAVDLQDLEMTLTLAQWHRYRDAVDDTRIVVPHQPQLLAA
jgi:hypothetical protein